MSSSLEQFGGEKPHVERSLATGTAFEAFADWVIEGQEKANCMQKSPESRVSIAQLHTNGSGVVSMCRVETGATDDTTTR